MWLKRRVGFFCIVWFLYQAVCAEEIGIRFVVDRMLLKDSAKRERVELKLLRDVAELNRIYESSQVRLSARIVGIDAVDFSDKEAVSILSNMAQQRTGFENVYRRAVELGADYTVAVVDDLRVHGKSMCGRAIAVNRTIDQLSSLQWSFAAVHATCGSQTLAHELGHLMGLNHGHLVDRCNPDKGHAKALTSYANGYGEGNCDGQPQFGEFGDVMVGGAMKQVNGKNNLPIFSNPRIQDERCGPRKICGDERIGDAARALNENAYLFVLHTRSK